MPDKHPLRKVGELVRAVLIGRNKDFAAMYAAEGRPSIPPEQLLRAMLLHVFYGLRPERRLPEQLDCNLLFRWFAGLAPDAPVRVAATFGTSRERLQEGDVFQQFMTARLNHARVKPLLSGAHFSVDGTLIEAWASFKSFNPFFGQIRWTGRCETTAWREPPLRHCTLSARRCASQTTNSRAGQSSSPETDRHA